MHKSYGADLSHLEVFRYWSIVMIVIQLIFCFSLQAFQVTKVKGAIRIYLIFDLLSAFAVNTCFFYRVKEHQNAVEDLGFETFRDFNSTLAVKDFGIHLDGILEESNRLFIDARKSLLVMIINDAYVMLCQPFLFKEHLETKNIIKRYLYSAGIWALFHGIHAYSLVIQAVLRITDDYFVGKYHRWFLLHLGFRVGKACVEFLYNGLLLGWGCFRCYHMRASLNEMEQNEFEKNKHCNSLYKMSLIFCTLLAGKTVFDIVYSTLIETLNLHLSDEMILMIAVASYDTLFSIVVMVTLAVCFPGLRPRQNKKNRG